MLARHGLRPETIIAIPEAEDDDPPLFAGVTHMGEGSRSDVPYSGRWIVEIVCGRDVVYSTDSAYARDPMTAHEVCAMVAAAMAARNVTPEHTTRLELFAADAAL